MRSIHTSLFILISILFNTAAEAQVKLIGTPFITNYSHSNYQAGSQTWAIEQGNNGMMYFANNNGLLEYDGQYWNVYPMPNNSIIRSIRNGEENIMYAGGFNEFGYYEIASMGGAKYNSLIHLLPDDQRNFGDVWKIYIHPDGVIFQTYTQIMFYKNNKITIIPAPSTFHFSFIVNAEYYVNDLQKGIMRYAMGNLHPLIGLEKLKGKEVRGIHSIGNKLLIVTASDGLFIYDGNSLQTWNTVSLQFLEDYQIYSSLQLSDELFAFGTIQNGLLISDIDGNPIQLIRMTDGLQNNTILSIELDVYGNLWLGTDLGIDYVEIHSPLSQLSFDHGIGTGYTASKFNNHLYLGSNQGLFVTDSKNIEQFGFGNKKIDLIEGTGGQVWTLNEIDGHLFCGHNNGTFLIQGKTAEKLSDIPGGWTFLQVPGDTSKIICGTFSGLSLYEKINDKWKFKKTINGFSESTRIIAFDLDGSLWMAHGYKGIFHLYFNPAHDSILKVDFYNPQNSNLSSSDVSLAKIGNKIIFTTLQNIYTFSPDEQNFVIDNELSRYLKGYNIRSIIDDRFSNIWYFEDDKSGVLRLQEDGSYSDINLPFLQINNKLVKGFQFVNPLDGQNIFFGAENGFIHYNPSINKDYTYQFQSFIRSVRTYNPDSNYIDSHTNGIPIVLDFSNNDLEFMFSANNYENPEEIMYSTYMEGNDQNWSVWSPRSTRDFTNLHEGEYIFKIKARNIYGTVTDEVGIRFQVLPPFHRSILAFVLYGLVTLILLLIFGLVLKRRFEQSKLKSQKEQQERFRRKEEVLQKEALEAEKQVIRLRNENLRAEMKLKDKELANGTMQTLHKNELLIKLRDEMKKLAPLYTDD